MVSNNLFYCWLLDKRIYVFKSDLYIDANSEVVNGFCVSWRKNVTESQKEAIRDILNDMHLVEGGTFLMGATQEQEPFAKDNEKPAHYVQLSDYYICKYEISISQLESILNKEFTPYDKLCGTPQFSWYDWRLQLFHPQFLAGVLH